MPVLNQMSKIPMSNGDNAGITTGVMSGMVMGPTSFILGSLKVITGGSPSQRMTSMTGQNGFSMNCPGTLLSPSQVKVILLS
jgi:hypothetical protein